MELVELQPLFDTYHRKLSKIDLRFKRYLYSQINWDARFIGIKGPRGVGKTTMLLQHILKNYQDVDQTLYASLDDLWFATHPLMDLVDWAYQHGIMRLYLDEVHRYNQWSVNLKNIYDNYPDMSIVYTSSSLLIMDNAKVDLSRRQTTYTLYGMSFREFLAYEGVLTHDALTFDDVLQNHVRYAMQITRQITAPIKREQSDARISSAEREVARPMVKVAPLFEAYLQHGYYPFYKESVEDFLPRLRETVRVVIDDDLPAVENVTFETIQKVKRLLMIISERVPFQPTMSDLWAALATNNELGLRMLYALDKAQILGLLTSKPKNYKYLNKPDKIFLGNPNLMHALCPRVEKGNERETFFYSQLIVSNEVKYPKKGDFYVNDKYLFEIGGRRKTFEQIADEPDSFLGVDDTEVGHGCRIPLWLFGFLY